MSASQERGRSFGPGLQLRLECNFASVRRGAAQVRAFLLQHGLPEPEVWACELAFVEGCNNAVQNTPAANLAQHLVIDLSCHRTHVELRINDHTGGCDLPAQSRLPASDEESGRGIFLMRSLMDEVKYTRNPASNCLTLRKARTGI